MSKIRIAQIGTSNYSHGNYIWNSLVKQNDIFEVVGFALPENEREKFPGRMKDFEGFREMSVEEILSDPTITAVTVETEEIFLTRYALMAAKAGKHIHMEKPGGVNLSDFEELIEILKAKNLTFTTGYMYRFNPKVKEAIEKIKKGELGEIYSVEAQMNCYHSTEWRQWLQNFPSGMLFFLGCHLIDLIYQIQGEPKEILPLSTSTGFNGVTSTDYGMVVFKYKNGVSFAKTCDIEHGGFLRRQLVVCGEKGSIVIEPLEVCVDGGQYTVMKELHDVDWGDKGNTTKSQVYDRFDGMMRNFAEIICGKENPYSYDYELSLYKLILKCCGKDN